MPVKTFLGKKQGGNTLTGMKTYYKTTVTKSGPGPRQRNEWNRTEPRIITMQLKKELSINDAENIRSHIGKTKINFEAYAKINYRQIMELYGKSIVTLPRK